MFYINALNSVFKLFLISSSFFAVFTNLISENGKQCHYAYFVNVVYREPNGSPVIVQDEDKKKKKPRKWRHIYPFILKV